MPFSWRIFLTLAAVFGLSLWMFVAVVRQATVRRRWMGMREWAGNRGMKLRRYDSRHLPPPLALIGGDGRVLLTSADTTIVQLRTTTAGVEDVSPRRARWNLLARRIARQSPVAAIRPAHADRSFIDLYALSNYPTLSSAERFVVRGADHAAARALAAAGAMNVVPSDIGLLVDGAWLVLDFSSRPFDPIEFERILDIASDLEKRL